jgi:hypothetical protein
MAEKQVLFREIDKNLKNQVDVEIDYNTKMCPKNLITRVVFNPT